MNWEQARPSGSYEYTDKDGDLLTVMPLTNYVSFLIETTKDEEYELWVEKKDIPRLIEILEEMKG